jgi:hypothetical protein
LSYLGRHGSRKGLPKSFVGTIATSFVVPDPTTSDPRLSTIILPETLMPQVDVAIRYIDEHRDEVMADYEKILARHARRNPPELQAKLDAAHERFLALVREHRVAEYPEATCIDYWEPKQRRTKFLGEHDSHGRQSNRSFTTWRAHKSPRRARIRWLGLSPSRYEIYH